MSATPPFKQALRDELLKAARRGPRPSRWRWAAAGAGALAAAAGSWFVLDSSPATADVEVRFEAGRIEVLLTDRTTTVEEVRDALRRAGVSARIDEQPAGPSNVGRFVSVLVDGSPEPVTNLDGLDADARAFSRFAVDDDWDGTIRISLGRPARPGEPYAISSDAFADGEPLDCSGILGQPLAPSLRATAGMRVRIHASREGRIGPLVDPTPEAIDAYGSWIITSADALAPDEVVLTVEPTAPVPAPREADC